jgi:hypothetical protein
MSFLLLLISTLQRNWRKVQNRFCLEVRWGGEGGGRGQGGEMTQTMYAHVNKGIIKKRDIKSKKNTVKLKKQILMKLSSVLNQDYLHQCHKNISVQSLLFDLLICFHCYFSFLKAHFLYWIILIIIQTSSSLSHYKTNLPTLTYSGILLPNFNSLFTKNF